MNFNKKIKEWFGFPLSENRISIYNEEVQELVKELNMTTKKAPAKKAPAKKAPAKKAPAKKAPAKKAPAKKSGGSGKPQQAL